MNDLMIIQGVMRVRPQLVTDSTVSCGTGSIFLADHNQDHLEFFRCFHGMRAGFTAS